MVEGDRRVGAAGAAAVLAGLRRDGLRPAHRVEPLVGALARSRHHPRDVHLQAGAQPVRDERHEEPAGRVPDDHDVLRPLRRRRDRVDAVVPGRVVAVGREVGRDGLVPPLVQRALHEVPGPAAVTGAVQEHEGGHASLRRRPAGASEGVHARSVRRVKPVRSPVEPRTGGECAAPWR